MPCDCLREHKLVHQIAMPGRSRDETYFKDLSSSMETAPVS